MAKSLLANTLELEDISKYPDFLVSSHFYTQLAGPEWRGKHGLWYPACLIPEQMGLKDVISLAYEQNVFLQRRNLAEGLRI